MGTSVSAQEMNHERGVDIERYRTNWVSHLLGIAGDLHRRVVTRLAREGGYDQLRPSLGPFLSLVWREPRPVTELARQLSMSRQGCGKILRIAEEAGYAERIEGRAGERAQLVRLTGRGRRLVDDAVRMITETESTYAEHIGEARLNRFRAAAATLFYGLGLQEKTDPSLGETARRSIGVLPVIAQCVEERLRATTRAKGHDVLQLSHARVIAIVGIEGARMSEISRSQGVSRQATTATVSALETLGYVRREEATNDGRGIYVTLTNRGEELVRDTLLALDELEVEFREILSARRLSDLLRAAQDLDSALSAENALLDVAFHDGAVDEKTLRAAAARLREHLGRDNSALLASLLSEGA